MEPVFHFLEAVRFLHKNKYTVTRNLHAGVDGYHYSVRYPDNKLCYVDLPGVISLAVDLCKRHIKLEQEEEENYYAC